MEGGRALGRHREERFGRLRRRIRAPGAGPARLGDLSHWHFDPFRAKWSDAQLGTATITFGLSKDGKPGFATVDGIGTFKRE